MKSFQETEFIIFDVETTGLSPQMGDRVVEVAALRVKDLKPVEQFHSLVNPGRDISSCAYLVNGITPRMLLTAPGSKEVFPALADFLGESVIVGHNIKFDLEFLTSELARLGEMFKGEVQSLCTARMSRVLLPEMGRYSLWMVAQELGVEAKQEHRALSDVMMTLDVFKRLLQIAERKDMADLKILTALFGNETREKKEDLASKISAIERAIQLKQMIQISYFSREQSAMTFRKVTPSKIVKKKGSLSLMGFCHLREAERIFRVDKILELNAVMEGV